MKYSSSGDVNSNSQGCNILSNTYNMSKKVRNKEIESIIKSRNYITKIRLTIHRNIFDTKNRYIKSADSYVRYILNYEKSRIKKNNFKKVTYTHTCICRFDDVKVVLFFTD